MRSISGIVRLLLQCTPGQRKACVGSLVDPHFEAASMQQCASHRWAVQVVADSDNDLEVGVFLGAYRQLAQRQDLETRRLCAESCTVVLKAATPRRSAARGFMP